jgi:hypothetical protein
MNREKQQWLTNSNEALQITDYAQLSIVHAQSTRMPRDRGMRTDYVMQRRTVKIEGGGIIL